MSLLFCLLAMCAAGQQPEVSMPLDRATVHRPPHVADRKVLAKLREAVVVVSNPASDIAGLAKQFDQAARENHMVVQEDLRLCALVAGSMLDGPDKVQPGRLVRRGSRIELDVLHTAVRLQGVQLRRNILWRPLVQVPLQLPAGHYRLKVTWRAVAGLPEGKSLKTPTRTASIAFEIRPAK